MTVISMETYRVRKIIDDYLRTNQVPEYVTSEKFLNDFRNIKELCDYWHKTVGNDNARARAIWSIFEAYALLLREQRNQTELEESNHPDIVKLRNIKNSFKTNDFEFKIPSVHSDYPFDSNPALILTYEASLAYHEKMGDYSPTKSNDVNNYILSFLIKVQKNLIYALQHDIDLLADFLYEMEKKKININDNSPEARAQAEAEFKHDEFMISMNTITTILKHISR